MWPLLIFLFYIYASNGLETSQNKPNIVLFITDDQDSLLGSMEFMPKTLKFFGKRGVEFKHAFVSTPICCPSRSTILTGIYAHTHNVMTNNQNCSGAEWRSKYENETFAVYLKRAGYRTAYFGKYLNEYDGSYVPQGWDHWMGLVKNSRYYNYTLNFNGKKQKHGFDYKDDYLTDLITNETLNFIEEHGYGNEQPFLIVLSYPAPHGPEDPAPQYNELFEGIDTHRTASYNFAPNPDKQWLLQHTGKMEPVHVFFTDLLHRRRLQTLQSVDDSVQKVMNFLRTTNNIYNTYSIFTSDHGYHLGQFGLIKGKSMPYEFDIRVPFFIRGPGLPKGTKRLEPIGNIDLAPTILAIANVDSPPIMHGRSILELFSESEQVPPWRETLLIERGKMPRLKKISERFQNQQERYSKLLRISIHCQKSKYSAPCKPKQEWICLRDADDRWRIHKCRSTSECNCRQRRDTTSNSRSDPNEQTLNKWEDEFLQEEYEQEVVESGEWFQGMFLMDEHVEKQRHKREADFQNQTTPCLLKSKLLCELPTNATQKTWNRQKSRIDNKIQKLRDRLSAFRKIRKNLKMNKPADLADTQMEQNCKCERPMSSKHPLRSHFATPKHRHGDNCTVPQMNCFTHDENHWATPPFWPENLGSFCFCQNANNNSYWCLRTINSTHNFLYCEFVTGFLSFYDLNTDPDQLTNTLFQLDNSTLTQLNAQLMGLKSCKTGAECEHYALKNWHRPLQINKQPDK